MAIPDYLSNVENTAIDGGTAGTAVRMERVKNLNWSFPDGNVLEDGNDNLEKPEFIRVVKVGRCEFSFECRDVENVKKNFELGGCKSITFEESDAKDTQGASKMTVEFSIGPVGGPGQPAAAGEKDVQWLGMEHSIAWGELSSTTMRGVCNAITLS